MARMNYTTAFEREIRRIVPALPPPGGYPKTVGALVDLLRPPPGTPRRPRSGTAEAARILGVSERQVQRYRAAEGTAPRGGQQARGARRGGRGGPDLSGPISRLQEALGQRAVAEVRRRGVFMRVAGLVAIKGRYFEERDSLPELFLSGTLLSLPWLDADAENHIAPLDALALLDYDEAAGGFDNSYWISYDPDDMILGSFTVELDYPGGLTLRLGPEP